MKTFLPTPSKRAAIFAALFHLSTAAITSMAYSTTLGTDGKIILIIGQAGDKFYKVSIDATGKFTSAKLPKGSFSFMVRRAPVPKSPGSQSKSNSNQSPKETGQKGQELNHVTFSPTKGLNIFVGGKTTKGKITVADEHEVTLYVSEPGVIV